ncbi:hypothetical protein E2C01_090632 [Portunus trituberculatus]|uniref:Uncharacterized protein n=1 Tax=Portunus trituberculatus TaxID=210409 RepID=A0A5B7JBU5_PORTR|nr:hypothetical protein [Portunus trituberculatus]
MRLELHKLSGGRPRTADILHRPPDTLMDGGTASKGTEHPSRCPCPTAPPRLHIPLFYARVTLPVHDLQGIIFFPPVRALEFKL